MSFLSALEREWVTIEVPGTPAPSSPYATYVRYRSDELPTPPAGVAELTWLERAARHPDDYMGSAFGEAVRDLSGPAAADLLDGLPLPGDFLRFLDGGLRDRLRSATDSYFDLGDVLVEVEGGHLLHLISDSQWVFHWLLYVGRDGSSAVLGTSYPAGYTLDPEEAVSWREEAWGYLLVADSFAEFVWRWWMDNDIFYRVVVEESEMTPEDRAYVQQYGSPMTFG